jgi:glycerol uptake facilitator protein
MNNDGLVRDGLAEFIGTFMLVFVGAGVATLLGQLAEPPSGNLLAIALAHGLILITIVTTFGHISGAHVNPAVTLAMAQAGKLSWTLVPGYMIAQMLGGITGGALVFFYYREHFKLSEDAGAKLACFATAPNVRNLAQAFFCEVIGTFVLVLPVFLMTEARITVPGGGESLKAGEFIVGLGTLGALPVALLVFGIGLSLGGTTGYAINPARDLGPRLAHAFLPVPGKKGSDWGYAWIPVIAPLVGGSLAALVYSLLT